MSLALKLILNAFQGACDVRAIVTRYHVNAGIICETIASSRSTRFTPDVVCLAEATFWSFGIVISERLHPGNLLEQLVEVFIWKIIESRV